MSTVNAAVSTVITPVNAAASAGNLLITVIKEQENLKTSHSIITKKMDTLKKIKCQLDNKLHEYWFSLRRDVDVWSSEVEKINLDVNGLSVKVSNSSDWNIKNLFRLTGEIDQKIKEIDESIQKGEELKQDLVKKDTPRTIKLNPTPINIESVPSFKKKWVNLLEYVKDETCDTIRVQGSPGTGKTILLQHLNNTKEYNKMFHIVIWIPASEFENHENKDSIEVGIQSIIAERLGICLLGIKDVNVRASKIHKELDGAKYLLLFDDVKVNIDLETIGIPKNTPKNTPGSKIIYTTSFGVFPFGVSPFHLYLTIDMENKLSDVDSWQIFYDILFKKTDLIRERKFKRIGREAVKLCDGRFSLIIIVANYFTSRETLDSWDSVSKNLRTTPMKQDVCMEALKKFLNFGYGSLQENEKKCFLFCLLYPEGHKIPKDRLFDCWAAIDLHQTSVSGEDILCHLLKKSLLTEVSNKQYVTIDNVLREAAMKILQEHKQLKCVVAPQANKRLQNNLCKDMHWISLANSGIGDLPTNVYCPELTTLFLQKNSQLKTISHSFFKNIRKLVVLDLYKTGFESMLPMSHLGMLKVLYVNGCAMLKEIPFKTEGLDHWLEVLDTRGCVINEIPDDIIRLKRLRRFMLSIDHSKDCQTLGDIKISELSFLKELIIDVISDVVHMDLNSKTSWCNEVIKVVLEKIDNSERLTTLQFYFKDDIVDVIRVQGGILTMFVPAQASLKQIWNETKKRYSKPQVYIGFRMTSNNEEIPEFFKIGSFVLSCENLVTDPLIEEVLSKVEGLIMMENNSMKHLDQMEICRSSNIHKCLVHRCDKVETLIQTDVFSNLKTLVLSDCSQLNVLFADNVVRVDIECLEISDCSALEEIKLSTSASGGDVLPRLTHLVLHKLWRLEKISSDVNWPLMSTLEIRKCYLLTELPLNLNNANNLRVIKVEEKWWDELQLDNEIKARFKQYCIFSK